jgi:hypothetical protein
VFHRLVAQHLAAGNYEPGAASLAPQVTELLIERLSLGASVKSLQLIRTN